MGPEKWAELRPTPASGQPGSVLWFTNSITNLDLFWARIDGLLHAKTNNLNGTHLKRLLSQPHALQRTPVWIEPEPGRKKDKSGAAHPGDSAGEMMYKPFSSLSFRSTGSKETATAATTPTTKVILRGTTAPAKPLDERRDPAPGREDVQPTFKVDARALKVFRVVFFNPGRARPRARWRGTTFCTPWRPRASSRRSCMGRCGIFSRRG